MENIEEKTDLEKLYKDSENVEEVEEFAKKTDVLKKEFECNICLQVFKSKARLLRHTTIHLRKVTLLYHMGLKNMVFTQ